MIKLSRLNSIFKKRRLLILDFRERTWADGKERRLYFDAKLAREISLFRKRNREAGSRATSGMLSYAHGPRLYARGTNSDRVHSRPYDRIGAIDIARRPLPTDDHDAQTAFPQVANPTIARFFRFPDQEKIWTIRKRGWREHLLASVSRVTETTRTLAITTFSLFVANDGY